MKERRAYARYNPAYCAETKNEKARKLVSLEDISQGGAAFRTEELLKKDQWLNLRLFLKNKMFEIKAVVVYVKVVAEDKRTIGARFLDPPRDFPELLEREMEEIAEYRKELSEKEEPAFFRKASIEYQKRKIF